MRYTKLLYEQIISALLRLIDDEEFLPGELIPSERELAQMYGVSRSTIKKAVSVLIDEGVLFQVHGVGTYVSRQENEFYLFTNNNSSSSKTEYSSFSARAKSMGFTTSSKVHFNEFIEPSRYLKDETKCKNNKLFCLIRTRITDDVPVVLEYSYADVEYDQELERLDFTKVSLYDYLEKNNYDIDYYKHTISLLKPPEKISNLLDIKDNTFVYLIEYFAYDINDQFIEYTKSYVRPDQIKLNMFEG